MSVFWGGGGGECEIQHIVKVSLLLQADIRFFSSEKTVQKVKNLCFDKKHCSPFNRLSPDVKDEKCASRRYRREKGETDGWVVGWRRQRKWTTIRRRKKMVGGKKDGRGEVKKKKKCWRRCCY